MASRLSRLVGTRFQVLFHSPPGVLFTFPSRYSSAIGHQGVFRLSGWSRQIHTEFHGLGATWDTETGRRPVFVYGALTLYGDPFQRPSTNQIRFLTPRRPGRSDTTVPRPRRHNACRLSHALGLASSAFARHYSRNHGCFLLLWVLRCFTSPRSLHTPYVFRRGSHHMTGAGFPHSDTLGSTLGWQLPEAYRSLPRPSSAPGAQASTVCPQHLGHTKPTNQPHASGPESPDHAEHTKDARVHCAVLNDQPAHPPTDPTSPRNRGGLRSGRPGLETTTPTHPAAPA